MTPLRGLSSLVKPELIRVKPEAPHWWSFVEFSATVHRTLPLPEEVELLQLEHEAELLNRINRSAFFLYVHSSNTIGLTDAFIEKDQLIIQRLFIKERFRNLGHGSDLLRNLVHWSKSEGVKQIVAAETSHMPEKLWKKIDATNVVSKPPFRKEILG
jgi:GNAT superfamily N-acetyltransferase